MIGILVERQFPLRPFDHVNAGRSPQPDQRAIMFCVPRGRREMSSRIFWGRTPGRSRATSTFRRGPPNDLRFDLIRLRPSQSRQAAFSATSASDSRCTICLTSSQSAFRRIQAQRSATSENFPLHRYVPAYITK